jgi:hypothetical protein
MKREFNARPHTQGSLKNNLKPSHNGAILIWRGQNLVRREGQEAGRTVGDAQFMAL